MKTLILWRRKRARTFKVIGSATADCSVLTITDMWHAAERGEDASELILRLLNEYGSLPTVARELGMDTSSLFRFVDGQNIKKQPARAALPNGP